MVNRHIDRNMTAEQLRAVLDYDPKRGLFRWRHRADVSKQINTRFAGTIAGWIANSKTGHMKITLNGGSYFLHRLAWLYVTGAWPAMDLDHIDGDPTNNRFANLRDVTKSQNCMNQRITFSHKTGLKGARFHKPTGRYQAQIMVNRVVHYLGLFDTPEAAHAAYCAAARRLHGDFARFD